MLTQQNQITPSSSKLSKIRKRASKLLLATSWQLHTCWGRFHPDHLTKYLRMAKNENLTTADTSVRELTGLLQVILSTHSGNRKIIWMLDLLDLTSLKENWLWGPEKGLLPATGNTEWLSITACIHFCRNWLYMSRVYGTVGAATTLKKDNGSHSSISTYVAF